MQISIYPFCGRITEIHQQRYHREDEHTENLLKFGSYFGWPLFSPILRIWSKSRIVYFTNILPARVWPEISSPAQFFACKPEYFVTNIFWIANQNILLQKYFLFANNIWWWVFLPASRNIFSQFCLSANSNLCWFADEYFCLQNCQVICQKYISVFQKQYLVWNQFPKYPPPHFLWLTSA